MAWRGCGLHTFLHWLLLLRVLPWHFTDWRGLTGHDSMGLGEEGGWLTAFSRLPPTTPSPHTLLSMW